MVARTATLTAMVAEVTATRQPLTATGMRLLLVTATERQATAMTTERRMQGTDIDTTGTAWATAAMGIGLATAVMAIELVMVATDIGWHTAAIG
jgi:hypothetical protein